MKRILPRHTALVVMLAALLVAMCAVLSFSQLVHVAFADAPGASSPEGTSGKIVHGPAEHTPEVIPAVAPTCTKTGLTEGSRCSGCGEILREQELVPPRHAWRNLDAVKSTCTQTGLTKGADCPICGMVFEKQSVVAATGHREKTLPAVAATCTKTGLTKGSKCTRCGEIVKAQQTVAAKGHTPVVKTTPATIVSEGVRVTKCSVCKKTIDSKVIPKLVVKPKTTKLGKLKGAKRAVTVTWAKQPAKTQGYGISGYQVRYSLMASMKGAKTKTVMGPKVTSLTIKKLKTKKKYYVQVRTYIKVEGKTCVSKWSKAKGVKTK